MTVAEIEAEVQRIIRQQHPATDEASENSYRVTVRMVQPESKVYYVLGEVNSPGAFPLIGRETVLDAIVQAGGIGNRANRHRLILSRPSPPPACRTVLPICYDKIVQLGDATTNYQIQPGDRIYVPSLTLTSEIMQCLVPSLADTCPSCSDLPEPCLEDGNCDDCAPGQPVFVGRKKTSSDRATRRR
jgi:polysaccharide export outer membrane protein